ncbi:MAG: hypothetical protein ACMUIU_18615, partial [bacterium]
MTSGFKGVNIPDKYLCFFRLFRQAIPLLVLILILLLLNLFCINTVKAQICENLSITLDVDGPDDVPVQQDVSQMGFDTSYIGGGTDSHWCVFLSFDDTSYTGGNSGDGCAFFDGDGDGYADFAICVSFEGSPVVLQSASLYDCKDNENAGDQGSRCPFTGGGGDGSNGVIARDTDGDGIFESDGDGNPLTTPLKTNIAYFNTDTIDPFDNLGRVPGQQDVVYDTGILFQIYEDELHEITGTGPTAELMLTNVCSFTSEDPGSERKDCIVNAGSGFIKIIKYVAESDPDATFDYTLGGIFFAQISTSGGEGQTGSLPVAGDYTYNLAEVVPEGWQLDANSCDNGDDPSAVYVGSGQLVTCTFENSVSNRPPECDAGTPINADCDVVTLSATASDPDEDTLTYLWTTSNCIVTPTFDPNPNVLNPTITFGTSCNVSCTLTLNVDDGNGGTCTSSVSVTVNDTIPPTLSATPGDVTVECDAVPDAASITATDNCDDDVPVVYNEVRTDGDCADNYTLTRTWTATDDCGNEASHTQTITVQDTQAPTFNEDLPSDATVECDAVPDAASITATDNCDDDVPV